MFKVNKNQRHCVKSVQIRSFFLVRIFLFSVRIQENTDQKKLPIWTLFTQCKRLMYLQFTSCIQDYGHVTFNWIAQWYTTDGQSNFIILVVYSH